MQCFVKLNLYVRIFRLPDISLVQLKMPNLHLVPVNLSNKDNTIVKVSLFAFNVCCYEHYLEFVELVVLKTLMYFDYFHHSHCSKHVFVYKGVA